MEQQTVQGKEGMEIYDVLKNEHDQIKGHLNELCSLNDDDDRRYFLVDQIKDLLIPHARAEESVFYNTLRAVNADKGLILDAYREHMEAEGLLRTLQLMDRFDKGWKKIAEKLRSALEHHIQEEETEVFNEARNAFTPEEAVSMADAFEQLKPKFRQEGFMKNTMDMVVNMMPPRIADKIRNFGGDQRKSA